MLDHKQQRLIESWTRLADQAGTDEYTRFLALWIAFNAYCYAHYAPQAHKERADLRRHEIYREYRQTNNPSPGPSCERTTASKSTWKRQAPSGSSSASDTPRTTSSTRSQNNTKTSTNNSSRTKSSRPASRPSRRLSRNDPASTTSSIWQRQDNTAPRAISGISRIGASSSGSTTTRASSNSRTSCTRYGATSSTARRHPANPTTTGSSKQQHQSSRQSWNKPLQKTDNAPNGVFRSHKANRRGKSWR